MTFREKAIRVARTQIGVHETGFSNTGPQVDKYEDADNLAGHGYPWCMAFVQWCFKQAGKPLEFNTASVGLFADWARKHGFIVTSPQRGDVVCFNFDSDNWPDHVGIVTKALPGGVINTIEGNTSPDTGGSQADGGEVCRKVRRTSRCVFVRIPGEEVKAKTKTQSGKRKFIVRIGKKVATHKPEKAV